MLPSGNTPQAVHKGDVSRRVPKIPPPRTSEPAARVSIAAHPSPMKDVSANDDSSEDSA